MAKEITPIPEDVKLFKQVCKDLHSAQSTLSYERVVMKVLDTKYGDFCRNTGGVSLHEIGYIFDITRERTRQIEATGLKKIKKPESYKTRLLNRYLGMSGDDLGTIKRYNVRHKEKNLTKRK